MLVAEGPRQGGELGDAAALRPGDQPGQQRAAVLALDREHRAELLLDQVALVEVLVAGGDLGGRGPLLPGQVAWLLAGRLTAALTCYGQPRTTSVTNLAMRVAACLPGSRSGL